DQVDGRPEDDARTGRQLGRIDHFRMRERPFEFLDAALDEALLLAGGVVFGVLLQVTVRPRFGDRIDDGRTLDRLELLQLFAQTLGAAYGHRDSTHACNVLCNS